MKIIKRGISYNQACAIMEANNYMIDEVKAVNEIYTVFYSKGRKVARYNEKYGRLEAIA